MSPAPWQYDINKDRSRALIVDAEGFTVAEIAGYTDMTETVELMTAAPDMLDALMDFVSYFGHDNDNGLDEMLTNARAAIAKATYTKEQTA